MTSKAKRIDISRSRRKNRVRKKLRGSKDRYRLCITKSCKHLYAQIIDDEEKQTKVGLGTSSKVMKEDKMAKKSKEAAIKLGELLAKKAQENQISKVVFDRGRYRYHGILAEFANAARKAGLEF